MVLHVKLSRLEKAWNVGGKNQNGSLKLKSDIASEIILRLDQAQEERHVSDYWARSANYSEGEADLPIMPTIGHSQASDHGGVGTKPTQIFRRRGAEESSNIMRWQYDTRQTFQYPSPFFYLDPFFTCMCMYSFLWGFLLCLQLPEHLPELCSNISIGLSL
jgi:hypothetical protein